MSWRVLPLLSALLLAPMAFPTATACVAGGLNPPCGYIQPFLDLDFPDKPSCGGAVEAAKCIPLPAVGQSLSMDGTLTYYWRLSEDGTYPPDMTQPIDITFKGTTNTPKWLTFKMEPESIQMAATELVDPRNLKTDDATTPPTVYFWFERPVTVTFTRTGDPDLERQERIAGRDGIEELAVKAKSTPNGSYFREGHGTETFRFDASQFMAPQTVSTSQQAPAWGLLGVVLVLGLAARRAR